MTTNNRRVLVRTPRKEKMWAHDTGFGTHQTIGNGTIAIARTLLAGAENDLGVSRVYRSTVMRIRGYIDLGNDSTAAVSNRMTAFWGIAWVNSQIQSASSGDSQIPDPSEAGLREAQWIWTGCTRGASVASTLHRGADGGQLQASVELDTRQMRKAPTTDHRLVLIVRDFSVSGTDPVFWWSIHTMLALA